MVYSELTEQELWELLFQKAENEMAVYMRGLDQLPRDKLIMAADEISAMATCCAELMAFGEDLPRKNMIFLLQQEKPLERLSEAWMEHRNVDVGETFQSLLTGLCDDAWQEASVSPSKTVRELLERHPKECVHLMTPCGFVDMDSSEAVRLLCGEAVMSHPGASGYQMPVEAEELLEMEVLSIKKDEQGFWYALADYPHQQMEQALQEPEMRM